MWWMESDVQVIKPLWLDKVYEAEPWLTPFSAQLFGTFEGYFKRGQGQNGSS